MKKTKPKVSRQKASSETFRKLYAKKKFIKEPVKPKCKVCSDGVLERRQWNMLNCTNIKCNHSELQ